MRIRRLVLSKVSLCLVLTAMFYFSAYLCIHQLVYLESSQDHEPAPHALSGKYINIAWRVSNRKTESIDNTSSVHKVSDSAAVTNYELEYMDWNDYELMAEDAKRQGIGEQGTAFNKTLSAEEEWLSKQLFNQYKFNAFASDHISLERSIVDTRTDACKTKQYLKNINASVSVIIVIHNEKNSTILRTLHSIVNRSPSRLLKEIVLVDDLSTMEELKEPLENYINQHFSNVVLIRNSERQGLIRTRMIGADASTGDILVFLDGHIEVNYNYLPPLVEPIILDYRKIVCPMIDVITDTTMQIRQALNREHGAFSWDMFFRRLPVYVEDDTALRPVAAMLGAAFAISRKWWEEIGKYDPGLEIWGGEQYEITFKSWQCGGSVVDAPCSRVSHVYRQIPYLEEVMKDHLVYKNFLRVARVWMDEYIEYVFNRLPTMRTIEPGNLTEQFAIRKRLNCKPFKWFMTEVASDIPKYFPLIEPPTKAWGKLRNKYNASLCVVPDQNSWLFLNKCEGSQNSSYIYDWRQHISFYKSCFSNTRFVEIYIYNCLIYEEIPTQQFVWDPMTGGIINRASKYCMDVNLETFQVVMAPCNTSRTTQSWAFDYSNSTLVDEARQRFQSELNL